MAGSAVSELIFFIAAIMISSAVAVTLIDVIDNYSESLGDEAALLRGEMGADMRMINDPMYVPYSNGTLTIYLKNTGTSDLSTEDLVVSANRTVGSGSGITVTLMDNSSVWSPGKTVSVSFSVPNLTEGVDYHGWASTSGLTSGGARRGTARDEFIFRVWEV